MASRSKSEKREAFIARAMRAGFPSVSMMAVPHTTEMSEPGPSEVAQRTARRIVGAVAPARVERLAASLDALMAADSAAEGRTARTGG